MTGSRGRCLGLGLPVAAVRRVLRTAPLSPWALLSRPCRAAVFDLARVTLASNVHEHTFVIADVGMDIVVPQPSSMIALVADMTCRCCKHRKEETRVKSHYCYRCDVATATERRAIKIRERHRRQASL